MDVHPVGLLLLLIVSAMGVNAMTIDERLMKVAPKSSVFDSFHMSPGGNIDMMVELDILMDIKQYMELRGSPHTRREKRKAIRSTDYRWKNCYVYYEFSANDFSDEDIGVIMESMEQWQKYTCLEFKPATQETEDKIVFQRGSGGCYSRLGRVGGEQEIGLSRGCVHRGVVVHEIGHAIGWIHEQARPDRDEYIRVNFNRIPAAWHPQFEKFDERLINSYGVHYDYRSIMHYSGNAVAPMSIETLDPEYQKVIGQREGLSFRDVMVANLMYQCSDMLCPDSNADCSRFGHDAFLFKPKGDSLCQCFCPGNSEEEIVVPCSSGGVVTTTPRPVATTTTTPPDTTRRPDETSTPPEPMECLDLREDCVGLVAAGECKMDMERMFLFCKKSCNFCGKENMCMDLDPSCALLALGHFCDHPDFKMIMENKCRKSCQFCTPVDPCQMQLDMGLADESSGSGRFRTNSVLGLLVLIWTLRRSLSLLNLL